MAAVIDKNGLTPAGGALSWGRVSGAEPSLRGYIPTVKTAPEIRVVPVVRWTFYLFVATIPFETADMGIPIEITAITLGLLLLSLVFQIPLCIRKPPLAFGLFAFYLVILGVPYFFIPEAFAEEARWQWMVQAQLVVMCWVAYNVLRSDRVVRNSLLILGIACAFVAVLQLSGIAKNVSEFGGRSGRITAFGFHPNNIARIMALGLLGLVGLAYGSRRSYIQPRWVVWIGFVAIGMAIVQTGSRGGLLALAAGLFVFVLRSGDLSVKVRNAFVVLVGIGFFMFLITQFEQTESRFELAIEEGKLARREQIYPMAWAMFLERPIFGWGITTAQLELGARLAHVDEDSKNAHNLILNTLITTGLIGGIPLFAGTFLAFLAAWKARHGTRGILPLSMITTVLVANMSGNWGSNKMHWLVIAFALSSAAVLAAERKRNNAVECRNSPRTGRHLTNEQCWEESPSNAR
jgi:O-antigen ligase